MCSRHYGCWLYESSQRLLQGTSVAIANPAMPESGRETDRAAMPVAVVVSFNLSVSVSLLTTDADPDFGAPCVAGEAEDVVFSVFTSERVGGAHEEA